jgi:hypothetical protein
MLNLKRTYPTDTETELTVLPTLQPPFPTVFFDPLFVKSTVNMCDPWNKQLMEHLVGSLKMNTTLEYSTRVVQEGDRRCKKSTLNDLAYLTPLRIPLMNPVILVRFPSLHLGWSCFCGF